MKLQHLSLVFLPFISLVSASSSEQITMGSIHNPFVPEKHTHPTLSDLLTIEQSASIFYSYARELELSKMFNDQNIKATLFVPTNKAVMSLARKPHQGQGSGAILDDIHITEDEYERKSRENVERWVSAHIIPKFPINLDSNEHPTLLDGKSISFKPISKGDNKEPAWTRVTLNDGAHILSMKEASNGVLYLIDTAISPE
ncbi:hypothetical protein D9756_006162 [Leucocoprinus leucothites]|uniref:FAS1 domain-containing protein n=1 Tax=Leucocoprinus leucothites TaxID=201217 RepID=A0A8H5FXI7_9AGAR|nr:hypothetical protein D9756_006162 [Leucoagaricus leucothites]